VITTIPVGSWSWETKTQASGDDLLARATRQVLDGWSTLRALGLAEGEARAELTVGAKDGEAVPARVKGRRAQFEAVRAGEGLFDGLTAIDRSSIRVVTVDVSTPGTSFVGGGPRRVEKLFMLSVDAWASGAGTLTLHTFSDAWLSHDLRGHKQPEVRQENAPRLRSALVALSRLTEADVIPADPTAYGIPTEAGFEDLPDEDPDLLDSWYMFEVPRRTARIQAELPPGTALFAAETDSPVESVEVALGGRVVGYLWAADGDAAAGYEPYTPAGDVALDVAASWLTRLGEAKQRGLPPSRALRELSKWTGDSRAGAVVAASRRVFSSLEELQDLSGRE
jgi:hypothetical protein